MDDRYADDEAGALQDLETFLGERVDVLEQAVNALTQRTETGLGALENTILTLQGLVETMTAQQEHTYGALVQVIAERRKRHPEKWNTSRAGHIDTAQTLLRQWLKSYTEACIPKLSADTTYQTPIDQLYHSIVSGAPVVLYDRLHLSLPHFQAWLRDGMRAGHMTMPRLRQLLKHDGWDQTMLSAQDGNYVYRRTQKRYWKQGTGSPALA